LAQQATEFGRWLPECRVVLYDGLPEERRALQREFLEPGDFNVCLTHYDLAMRDRAALRKVVLVHAAVTADTADVSVVKLSHNASLELPVVP
jgi:hypothetical protein